MKAELIGYPLDHSWSPEIHRYFLGIPYELHPLQKEELGDYFAKKDFDAVNVTIPYKETVIQFLDELDEKAREIGAVNCVINDNGTLKGYNTDCLGFMEMVREKNILTSGMRAAVLGSGGASKAVCSALRTLGAEVTIVSRTPSRNRIGYDELYSREAEFDILVNTTPVGMYPDGDGVPVDVCRFHNLKTVVDVVANPLRTRLLFEAEEAGIDTLGGFEMLVRQALATDRLLTGKPMEEASVTGCMREVMDVKRSIVLIGMPTSGKTTIAGSLARATGRQLFEMDEILEKEIGMPITECFARYGETHFRSLETDLARRLRTVEKAVISCGGGVIKNPENMRYLREKGIVFWINRDPEKLFGTPDRPLSQSKEQILKLYEERKDLYERYSDHTIMNNDELERAINEILRIAGEKVNL